MFSTELDAKDATPVTEDTAAMSKRPGFSGTLEFHFQSPLQTSDFMKYIVQTRGMPVLKITVTFKKEILILWEKYTHDNIV